MFEIRYFDTTHEHLANGKMQLIAIGRPHGFDTVCGMVTIEKIGEFGFLNGLFVQMSDRRNGLGSRLVEHAVNHCRAGKYRGVTAAINHANESSVALFEKIGFQRVMDYPGDPVGLFAMQLNNT